MSQSPRLNISSGSPMEPLIGFSRAVRVGPFISIAGTAPIAEGGGTVAPGDAAAQARRCLQIIETALRAAGGTLADVVRTRVLLTRIEDWEAVAVVHGETFGTIRPVCTVMQVVSFVDPDWLVEFEVDAIVPAADNLQSDQGAHLLLRHHPRPSSALPLLHPRAELERDR